MDGTNGAAFLWQCASNCPGGSWANKDCACACVPDPNARPTTTSTRPAITTRATPTEPSYDYVAPRLPLPSTTSLQSQTSDPVANTVEPNTSLPWWLIGIIAIIAAVAALCMVWLCSSFFIIFSGVRNPDDPDLPKHHKRAQVAPAPAIVVTDIEAGKVTTTASDVQVRFTPPDRSPSRSPSRSRDSSRGSSAPGSSNKMGSKDAQLQTSDKILSVPSTHHAKTLSPSRSPRTLPSKQLDAGAARAPRGKLSVPGSKTTSPSLTPERQRSKNNSPTRSPSASVLDAQARSTSPSPSAVNRLSVPGSGKKLERQASPHSSSTRSPSPNVEARTPSTSRAGSSSKSPRGVSGSSSRISK
eukprot:TRINITY_DN5924_c0_g3_i1.p1 TRINITY_DN5924_c0_g3~~TRINITY_DN5924_c0_g3_i1.p1  ORF type:complete len:412 (+),score=38.39 TRINITY_DN5924_c0_g3_i1:166-1236(+)